MFTVERRTGRLVEARIFRLSSSKEVDDYLHAFTPRLLSGRPTLLADHRPVPIYTPAVAAKLIEIFSALNSSWERVAILIAETNATLSLQFQRIVREAQNPSRRVFTDATEALTFLRESLQPLELARAASFLAENPSSLRRRPAS